MINLKEPTNNYEALVNALYLACTAPTDEKMRDCLYMAKDFADSQEQLEKAQAEVERMLREGEQDF